MSASKLLLAVLLTSCAAVSFAQVPSAAAASPVAKKERTEEWREKHPRRAEVNARLTRQHRRIADEVKEGDMSKAKAGKLRREDRQIRQEERDMAAQNGGHITKAEQKALNQQENVVSKQIGK